MRRLLRSILSVALGFATTVAAVILANLVLFSILGLDWEDSTGESSRATSA